MIDCVGLQVLILSVNCQCICPALGFGSIQVVGLVLIWSGERLAAKLFGIFIGWPNTGLWDPHSSLLSDHAGTVAIRNDMEQTAAFGRYPLRLSNRLFGA